MESNLESGFMLALEVVFFSGLGRIDPFLVPTELWLSILDFFSSGLLLARAVEASDGNIIDTFLAVVAATSWAHLTFLA